MFEGPQRAYHDAGVDPRTEIDSFVAARRTSSRARRSSTSTCPTSSALMAAACPTVAADGLFGVATGMMLIRSGLASIVAVEAHSKVSDVRTLGAIEAFALDPVLNRPLRFRRSRSPGST